MDSSVSTTGNTGTGSVPGTLAWSDWKKWLMAVAYVVGSAAAVSGLNALLDVVNNIDFSTISITFYGFKVNGMLIGAGLVNIITYLIALVVKDTRK